MIDSTRTHRLGASLAHALCAIALVSLSACSSGDDRPLVLVSAPLGVYADAAARIDITVTVGGVPLVRSYTVAGYGNGNRGIYLDSGTNGSATVAIAVFDGTGCAIARGSQTNVVIKAGEKTAVVTIALKAVTEPCQGPDGGLPTQSDGGVPVDLPAAPVDVTPSVSEAGGPQRLDGGAIDVRSSDALVPDVPADGTVISPVLDAAAEPVAGTDVSGPDLSVAVDVALDVTPDAPLTPMNLLGHCATYAHVEKTASFAADVSVTGVLFTPDGKQLVSLGSDGKAKVWDVTATGLVINASHLEFVGTTELRGTMRSDGKYLAIGDYDGTVTVYNLPASIAARGAVNVATLLATALPGCAHRAAPRAFTPDGDHLMVDYRSCDLGSPNQVAVWDISTQKVTHPLNLDSDSQYPLAFLSTDFATSIWLAVEETVTPDGGWGSDSVISLVNLAATPPSTVQFTAPGADVWSMAFSPDGKTLALGAFGPKVTLWDVSNKDAITQLGPPLITGNASSNWTHSMAFSTDGKYLAMAINSDFVNGPAINLSSVEMPRQNLTKTLDYGGVSVALASDGLALAVGEENFGTILYCTP